MTRRDWRQWVQCGIGPCLSFLARSLGDPGWVGGITAARSKLNPRVDIGIITIRDDEFEAILSVFPDRIGLHRATREYTLLRADSGGEETYTIAVLRQIEQGNGEAQNAARDLIEDLSPSLLLVVGIAGGVPSDDYTLGDVVISTRIQDFCLEARKVRGDVEYSVSGGPIGKQIAAGVANLASRHADLGMWTKGLPRRPAVEWKRKGQLSGSVLWQQDLSEKLDIHFGRRSKSRGPIFISGTIASSDRLVKDPALLIPWLKTSRHLRAIEMEAAGVYRAATERCPMLAIRGISDLVGLKRNDDWAKFACKSAAAFTRAYLRTGPVERKRSEKKDKGSTAAVADPDSPEAATDEVFTNLVRLIRLPETVYVAPATVSTVKQAWAKLLKNTKAHIPHSWALNNKNIYSFEDPSGFPLRRIVDDAAVEAHPIADFAESDDPERRRLLVQLLNGALRDDLGAIGVWYFHDDQIYAFAGKPKEKPRTVTYRNVRQMSTLTVVSHYPYKSKKDGKQYELLRHLAFQGRFREFGGAWFLEINPTYRFTYAGREKSSIHEKRLSGIKRLEGNRAVLSQVLLWSDLLTAPSSPTSDRERLLGFEKVPSFELPRPELTSDSSLSQPKATEHAGNRKRRRPEEAAL